MSKMSEENDENDVKEGLLCPICMQDLGTVIQLEQHFETYHSAEDKAIINSLKGLFGKAKRKILRKESDEEIDETNPFNESSDTHDGGCSDNYVYWEPQEIGVTVSHLEKFKQIRSSRIDSYVIETNKLLIRLDKLLINVPSDPRKRKAHEQSIVSWVNDNDVKLCPTCAKTFSLARRRHHCRLCGGVMCMNCSKFIEFSDARKMTNPAFVSSQKSSTSTPGSSPMNLFPLRRTGSNSSLASMINYSSGEEHIRSCHDCKKLLDRRNQQIEQRTNKQPIMLYYEKLKEAIEEAKRLIPIYTKLSDSLNQGETNYHLKDAQELKLKLMKIAETIDAYSKKILILGIKDDPPPHPKSLQLQKMIRQSCTIFLQDNMVGLPKIPNSDELKKLQETRRNLIQKQIQREKEVALIAQQQVTQRTPKTSKLDTPNSSPHKGSVDYGVMDESLSINVDDGWVPESSGTGPTSSPQTDDPILQQIQNIKLFIRQAREAHKYDEVEILEENLKLLQKEFYRQSVNASQN